MGIFDIFKKEAYINRLVHSYKVVYECDDATAINTLRKNSSKDELKLILDKYKELNKQGGSSIILENFFKEKMKFNYRRRRL